MSNALSEEKKQQVIALGKLGWSLRKIERETGVRRETAGAYLRAAGIAVRIPRAWGRWAPAKPANEVTPDPSKPAIQVTPDSGAKPANEVTPDFVGLLSQMPSAPAGRVSACKPYRDLIEEQLSRGRNAKAIWQDLVTDHGYPGDYQTVKRFVRRLGGSKLPQAAGIILTEPGEEAQVDYGSGPLVRDPQTGKYRRTRLFVLTLGYSRKSIRLLVWQSSAQTWAALHERAFRRLGSSPRVIILDNLKEGVQVPDIYDPTVNPLYRDVLAHYGVVALPCRIQDPDRKGKVESGIGHTQKTPLKGMRFESLEEAQAYLDRWEERWADTRIHGTTKRQVAAMFTEEKPHLQALPLEPFRYYQYGERVVHLDGCVEVEAAYYGLPPGWIGGSVNVQRDELFVRILDPKTGLLLREHVRQKRGWYRIKEEDHPKQKPLRVSQLLWRAERAGVHIGTLCNLIYGQLGEPGIRRILGVLSLAKKFGTAAVEDACTAALERGVHEYRLVRRYLERGPQLTLRQVDPLIRELVHYRDLIHHRTQEPPE